MYQDVRYENPGAANRGSGKGNDAGIHDVHACTASGSSVNQTERNMRVNRPSFGKENDGVMNRWQDTNSPLMLRNT